MTSIAQQLEQLQQLQQIDQQQVQQQQQLQQQQPQQQTAAATQTKVLVAFATYYGSTATIAEAIARRLREGTPGAKVDVVNLSVEHSVPEPIASYNSLVLGSPLHANYWLSEATKFAKSNQSALAGKPVFLFTVCGAGETSSYMDKEAADKQRRERKEPSAVTELKSALTVKEHRFFGGVMDFSKVSVLYCSALQTNLPTWATDGLCHENAHGLCSAKLWGQSGGRWSRLE